MHVTILVFMKMSEVIRTGFLYQHYILKYPIMSFFQFETENFVLWIAVCHIMLILMLKINFTLKNIIWKSINRNRIDGPKLDIQTNNTFLYLLRVLSPIQFKIFQFKSHVITRYW